MKTNREIEPKKRSERLGVELTFRPYTKRRSMGPKVLEHTVRPMAPKVEQRLSAEEEKAKEAQEASRKDWMRYKNDVENSDSFEVGTYPRLDRGRFHGYPMVHRIYDSSHTDSNLDDDMLLCLAKLAICFYNIREDTHFHNVKLIMATKSGIKHEYRHITFEATGERESVAAVTFQAKLFVSHPNPFPRFEIIFVRIKPDHIDPENSLQNSEFDSKAQIYQQRFSQVIETYTLDSQLDSRYNLALYLSQYALVSRELYTSSGPGRQLVAKYDIESLEVVELMKPVAEYPATYHITFKARGVKTRKNRFTTFKAGICMPILFPTTHVHLKPEAKVIRGR